MPSMILQSHGGHNYEIVKTRVLNSHDLTRAKIRVKGARKNDFVFCSPDFQSG